MFGSSAISAQAPFRARCVWSHADGRQSRHRHTSLTQSPDERQMEACPCSPSKLNIGEGGAE